MAHKPRCRGSTLVMPFSLRKASINSTAPKARKMSSPKNTAMLSQAAVRAQFVADVLRQVAVASCRCSLDHGRKQGPHGLCLAADIGQAERAKHLAQDEIQHQNACRRRAGHAGNPVLS